MRQSGDLSITFQLLQLEEVQDNGTAQQSESFFGKNAANILFLRAKRR